MLVFREILRTYLMDDPFCHLGHYSFFEYSSFLHLLQDQNILYKFRLVQ